MPEEISAAEKRRLLREKRANRLANGGSRLNKILGTDEYPEVVDTTPKSSTSQDSPITTTTPVSTSSIQTSISNATQRKNNRVSMILDPHNDPPTSTLDEFEVSLESEGSPLDEFASNEKIDMNIEEMLNKMLQFSGKDGHEHGQQALEGAGIEDIFGKDMASMMASMGNMPGMGGLGGMSGLGGMGGLGGLGGLPGMSGMGSPMMKNEVEVSRSKVFQSTFSVFRILVVFMLVQTGIPESLFSAYELFPYHFTIWNKFLCTEVVFGLLQLVFTYFSIFPNNTIMSFDISSFGYANSILNAYGLVRNFYQDFCCLILAIGLSAYFM